jgi:hypothetical protein
LTVFPALEAAHLATVAEVRPCDRCRAVEAYLAALPETRFGKRQTEILLHARLDGYARQPPTFGTRSESEARARACRTLSVLGLIKVKRSGIDKRVATRDRFRSRQITANVVKLTALGAELVRVMPVELLFAAGIDWATVLPVLRRRVRLRGRALGREFVRRLRATIWDNRALYRKSADEYEHVLTLTKRPVKPIELHSEVLDHGRSSDGRSQSNEAGRETAS